MPLSNDTTAATLSKFKQNVPNCQYNGCTTRMEKSAAGRAKAVRKIKLLENAAIAYDGFSMLVCKIFFEKVFDFDVSSVFLFCFITLRR